LLRAKRVSLVVFLVTTLGFLGCDQLTKEVARSHLSVGKQTLLAFGTVQLTLAENPGGFMSLGSSLPEVVRQAAFRVGVPMVLLVLCVALLRQPVLSRLDSTGLALVVGGGLGNWLDRMLQDGLVTDFVRVGVGTVRTGIFNAADVAILLGVAVLLASSWCTTDAVNGKGAH
jgi:signal peptidase II